MLEKMKEMLAEQLNCEASIITPETSFKDDLGADSLDLFELVMALEDEYNVEIPAEELTDLNTVGDVIEYRKNKGVEEEAGIKRSSGTMVSQGIFLCIGKTGDSVGKPMDILKALGI